MLQTAVSTHKIAGKYRVAEKTSGSHRGGRDSIFTQESLDVYRQKKSEIHISVPFRSPLWAWLGLSLLLAGSACLAGYQQDIPIRTVIVGAWPACSSNSGDLSASQHRYFALIETLQNRPLLVSDGTVLWLQGHGYDEVQGVVESTDVDPSVCAAHVAAHRDSRNRRPEANDEAMGQARLYVLLRFPERLGGELTGTHESRVLGPSIASRLLSRTPDRFLKTTGS